MQGRQTLNMQEISQFFHRHCPSKPLQARRMLAALSWHCLAIREWRPSTSSKPETQSIAQAGASPTLSAIGKFERELIRECTLSGMEAATRRGRHLGRPFALTESQTIDAGTKGTGTKGTNKGDANKGDATLFPRHGPLFPVTLGLDPGP